MALERKITETLNKKIWIIPVLFVIMCVFFITSIAILEVRGFKNLEPTFAFSVGGEVFAMMVSIVLVASILPAYKRQSGYVRIFVTLLTVGCFSLFFDIVQMVVDGIPEFALFNKIICIFVFASEIAFTYFFWLYVNYVLKVKGKVMNVLSAIAFVALIGFYFLPFVNLFYPLYFTIDSDGVYHRMTMTWWICRIYIVLIVIFVIVALILSKEKIRTKLIIVIFMGLPLVALGAGGYQYGVSILYSSMMVSLVLIYALLFSDNEKHLYSTNKELGLATNIQKHMLPSIFPAFPERKEFDIYALMNPAKEVGGDFYDFFLIDETHLGIVMADVSDKGVPAALFMMASKIMIQNYAMMGYSPKEVLSRANKQICSNNQDEMFVTVWLGILDLNTGLLVASNGGHEKPIIKKPNGSFEILNDKHNFVVGFFADAPYSEYQIQLEKGSKLFVYTDGIPESNNGNEQFGMNRTLDSLNKYKDLSTKEICDNLLHDIREFRGEANQFDDVTMLCLEYEGCDSKSYSVTIPADVAHISNGIKPITNLLQEIGVEHKIVYKIELALDELLTNVASYAYPPDVAGEIEIQYEIVDSPNRMISISIIDEGKEFDPLSLEEPDISLSSEDRAIGGLGLFIVKNTMDEMKYDRKNNKNVLTIKKKI